MTTLRSAKSSIPFVHDVIPGLLYVDILSRDPPEAKIVETTHTAECLRISEWKSFHVPVYFSVADAFEVKVIVRIGNVDASSDSTVVLFKKNESLEKLTLSFDNNKTIIFDIEYLWKPIEIESWQRTSLSRSQQVCHSAVYNILKTCIPLIHKFSY